MPFRSVDCFPVEASGRDDCLDAGPGAFFISNENPGSSRVGKRLVIVLPIGERGRVIDIPIWQMNSVKKAIGQDDVDGEWLWDGDKEKPTLTPSIRNWESTTEVAWHGYLTAGRLVASA